MLSPSRSTPALSAQGPSHRGKRSSPDDPARESSGDSLPLARLWALGLLGGLLVWLALPPAGWSALAWIALVPWIHLIRDPRPFTARHYRHLYLVGLVHWLVMIQWIRLPHWSAYFGWLALAVYLAVYVPWFVGAARYWVHGRGASTLLAAPLTWVGLELARGHLLTGFSLALLGHSQVYQLRLIQVADLGGAYAVSLVLALAAASLERLIPMPGSARRVAVPLAVAAAAVLASIGYGHWRLVSEPAADQSLVEAAAAHATTGSDGSTSDSDSSVAEWAEEDETRTSLRVALIQGSIDTTFDNDPTVPQKTIEQYLNLTARAQAEFGKLDLVIWPESMFTPDVPIVKLSPPLERPNDWKGSPQVFEQRMTEREEYSEQRIAYARQMVPSTLITGAEVWEVGGGEILRFNSTLWIDGKEGLRGRYDKMHPVMFGEYVPLGKLFPWLYQLTPMHTGLEAGDEPSLFQVGPLRISPSICFENTVPHLLRRQVRWLRRNGQDPNCLVTVTNDGWFWGSSLLDLHFICGVFRAVELRMPMLIAANTGFSGAIDSSGRVLVKGPRRATAPLFAEVSPGPARSVYLRIGDWPYAPGLVAAFFPILLGVARGLARRRAARNFSSDSDSGAATSPAHPPAAGVLVVAIALATLGQQAVAESPPPTAIVPRQPINLLDARHRDRWLIWHPGLDAQRHGQVYRFESEGLHLTGEGLGYARTQDAYRDYHLVCEFRWGNRVWPARRGKARDSGLFLHTTGPDGNSEDGEGAFRTGIECQIMEGAVGDLMLIRGRALDGTQIPLRLTSRVGPDRDSEGWPGYDAAGEPFTLHHWGRINRRGKAADWADVWGFRDPNGYEHRAGEWNRLECRCQADRIDVWLNGRHVHSAYDLFPSEGAILVQCEGAEITFRRLELRPLGSTERPDG